MPRSHLHRLTITEVAHEAGVSPTTVSHTLNGKGQVDERTQQRVYDAARKLDYRPSLRAQRLRTGSAQVIALVGTMPLAVAGESSRLSFLMEITTAAAQEATRHGYALILAPAAENPLLFENLDIDGAIVAEPVEHDAGVQQLRQRSIEVVTIGREPEADSASPHVEPRGEEGCRVLLEHLSQQGAQKIGLILGQGRRHSTVEFEETYTQWTKCHQKPTMIAMTKEEQLIHELENISPKQLLEDLSSGNHASEQDLKVIREIMTTQGLPSPVMNVLIHYVLLQTNMKLSKAYLEKIASHWSRANLQTAREAMVFAKKEKEQYRMATEKKQQTYRNYKQQGTRKEVVPEWFKERKNKTNETKKGSTIDLEREKEEISSLLKQYSNSSKK